jgi:aminopeptidase N
MTYGVRTTMAVGLAAVMTVGLVSAADAADHHRATPGALTIGDSLYTGLGNGGYDALSYDVRFDYRPGVSTMASSVTMRAVATQSLSRFSLDSAGRTIHSVVVNGRPATFRVTGEKLVITPAAYLPRGRTFTVAVGYTADRSANPPSPAYPGAAELQKFMQPWENTPDGFALLGQPDREHVFFPSNDHPSDKALFTFRVTTPSDVTAVASGSLVARSTSGGRTTIVYRTSQPVPTDVAQVAVGRFREIDQRGPHGLPVRSYVPAGSTATDVADAEAARRTPEELAWLERTIGRPFPFSSYGVLAVDGPYGGVALESATLSTFSALGLAQPTEQSTQVHEMTHQYFGDAVSVGDWNDMWLSEGHATFYQWLYASDIGQSPLDETMKDEYETNDSQLAGGGPIADLSSPIGVLFNTDAAGALTLYALRNLVGADTFRRIEQTFFDRYRNRSATTADYVEVANRVSGRDLTGFFHDWLYTTRTPPMPGHPDWHQTSS